MPNTCSCPSCGCRLTLPDAQLGKPVVCGKCRTEFTSSAASTEFAPPASHSVQTPAEHLSTNRPKLDSEIGRIAGRSIERQPDDEADYPLGLPASCDLPGEGVTIALLILLAIFLFVEFALIAGHGIEYVSLAALAPGQQPVPATVAWAGRLNALLLLAWLATFFPSAIVFCVWTHRAYKNLPILNARGLASTPAMAVVSFFIPIVSLYKPATVFVEIWKASNPSADLEDPYAWQTTNGANLIGAWWLSWLAANFFGFYGFGLAPGTASDPTNLQWESLGQMIGVAVGLVNTALAMLVIHYLRQRQVKKYERLQSALGLAHADPLD